MNRNFLTLLGLALLTFGRLNPLAAQTPANDTESRLRDALRTTMLQLRDAQTQVATLQENQAESDKEKADLGAKVDALTNQVKSLGDQSISDKAASNKTIADLKQNYADLVTNMVDTLSIQINSLNKPGPNDKVIFDKSFAAMKSTNAELSKQLDQYATDIKLWTVGYDQYVQFSSKTEAERGKLAIQVIMLQRVVADRETKNLALFTTANDILDRYEKFSLGDALVAKEPFVGITRVKLQEFVQDYRDKLTAQRVSIGQAPATALTEPVPSVASAASLTKPAKQ